MSLDGLLRDSSISRVQPDPVLADRTLQRAARDVETAKSLVEIGDFDWALAVAYNAMLSAGRAHMFYSGYKPSSIEGHLAVVRYLGAVLKSGVGGRLVVALNGLRKKRHRIVYEEMDIVSEDEARRAIGWAEEFTTLIKGEISHEG